MAIAALPPLDSRPALRMTTFPTPCREPGCGKATREPYCPDHMRAADRGNSRAEDNRPKTAVRGYGGRHRKWRRRVLARDRYRCVGWGEDGGKVTVLEGELCHDRDVHRGCWNEAVIADHRVPLRLSSIGTREQAEEIGRKVLDEAALVELLAAHDWRGWVRYALANGQAMCAECHNRKTAAGY